MNESLSQIQILLTERCNLRCRHCAVPEEDSPATEELDTRAWRTFLRHSIAGGVRSVVISGGEALLRPEAVDLAVHAHELGAVRTTLVTNGLLFRGPVPGRIAEAQRRWSGFGVHVSIDGASAATHDWMRGPGTFHRTLRSIERLRVAGGRITGLHTVLHQENRHELRECARLAERLGVEVWTVFPIASLGRAQHIQERRLDAAQWRGVIEELRGIRRSSPVTVNLMGPVYGDEWPAEEPERPNPVRELAAQTCVGPDGAVFTCPPLRAASLGDVRAVGSAEDWTALAERATGVLRNACGGCKFLLLCAGADLDHPYRASAGDGPRGLPVPEPVR